ncbi:MAG: methionyl-tRNA formyltransferase, partial [Lentisphaeria bacterium]|nr:methionyl-tRNA formyltransferase [Lentisphaeria bacterium]
MLRVYMLGSGPIAVPVLKKLYEQSRAGLLELVGVGTQPDRPAGRKRQLMPTPVGEFAAANNIAIDKYVSLNDGTAQSKLEQLKPDFLLVVSYGQLLKKPLLELPKYGCVNIHASLLPRYRGASPITHAIADMQKSTGVCFMDMEVGLDSGKVYSTLVRELDGTEYADALEIELGEMAAEKTLETLENIASGALPGSVQDPALVTMTTKLKKSDGVIDWHKSACAVEAMIRAYTPWPGAVFTMELNGEIKSLTITRGKVVGNAENAPAGTVVKADRRGWVIACGEDALEIVEVVPQGKKAMSGANYLNGCREPLLGKNMVNG